MNLSRPLRLCRPCRQAEVNNKSSDERNVRVTLYPLPDRSRRNEKLMTLTALRTVWVIVREGARRYDVSVLALFNTDLDYIDFVIVNWIGRG